MNSRMRMIIAGVLGTFSVVMAAAAVYTGYYQDRGLPRATIAGTSITGMTRAEVRAELEQQVSAVTVSWTVGTEHRHATLAELGYAVDIEQTVRSAFAHNDSLGAQLSALVAGRSVPVVVTTDESQIDAVTARIVSEAGLGATNAQVVVGPDGVSFSIIPAAPGKAVNPVSFQDVIAEAAGSLAARTTELEFVEADPDVSDAEAEKAAEEAQAFLSVPVTVSDGEDEHNATEADKAAWVAFPVAEGVLDPQIDPAKVTAWLDQVASECGTPPVNGQRYVDPEDAVLAEIRQPVDGEAVSNVAQLSAALADSLATKSGYTGTFEYAPVAAVWEDTVANSLSDVLPYIPGPNEKWIEVDLSSHTMRAFEGTTVVYGPVSVVNGASVTPTVVGVFHIYRKVEMKTMRGFNVDGTPYEQPDVPWISYFYSGYALHGAPYRKSFGYAASHGCVNLPVSAAKWIYNWAPIGTAVVTHR